MEESIEQAQELAKRMWMEHFAPANLGLMAVTTAILTANLLEGLDKEERDVYFKMLDDMLDQIREVRAGPKEENPADKEMKDEAND